MLLESLGQRIAAIGRLSYLGSLGYATADGAWSASAQRRAAAGLAVARAGRT